MKRSDVDTKTVLAAVAVFGVNAWDVLSGRPPKVVRAAFEREVKAGRLDYGVCLERPFLTDKGREWLGDAVYVNALIYG